MCPTQQLPRGPGQPKKRYSCGSSDIQVPDISFDVIHDHEVSAVAIGTLC